MWSKTQTVLSKKKYYLVWQHFKDFLVPKIVDDCNHFTVCLVLKEIGIYSNVFISFYSISLGLSFYKFSQNKKRKKKQKERKKRWLFEEIINQYKILPESLFSVSYIRSNL
jgi:hypothetical protein